MEPTDSTPGILLPEHRVRVFDPVIVYAERIGDRAIVDLDTNIWIVSVRRIAWSIARDGVWFLRAVRSRSG